MLAAASAFSIFFSSPAYPCASLSHKSGSLAESDAGEAIFSLDGDESVVEYQVTYTGDATDFGWIIPIPSEFVSLEDGDAARFDALRDVSQPQVDFYFWDGDDSGGGGCFCAGKGSDNVKGFSDTGSGGDQLAVEIVAEGFTGSYDYTVVNSDSPSDLTTWLDENGWDAGYDADTISGYAEDGFSFALITITPTENETPEEGRSLPPVKLRMSGSQMIFPARMASTASTNTQRTILYVLGDSTAAVTDGWAQTSFDYIDGTINDDDPSTLYDNALWEITGDTAAYALVYSSEVESQWLTRFETWASRSVHTADVTIEFTDSQEDTQTRVEMHEDGGVETGLAWMFLPLLSGWAIRRRNEPLED